MTHLQRLPSCLSVSILVLTLAPLVAKASRPLSDKCFRQIARNDMLVVPDDFSISGGTEPVIVRQTKTGAIVFTAEFNATLDGRSCVTSKKTSYDVIADWLNQSASTYEHEISELQKDIQENLEKLKRNPQDGSAKFNLEQSNQDLASLVADYRRLIEACSKVEQEKVRTAALGLQQKLSDLSKSAPTNNGSAPAPAAGVQ